MKIVNNTSSPELPTQALRRAIAWLCKRAGIRMKDLGEIVVVNSMVGQARMITSRGGRVNVPFSLMDKTAVPKDGSLVYKSHDAITVKRLDDVAQRYRLARFVEHVAWVVAYVQMVKHGTNRKHWSWHHQRLLIDRPSSQWAELLTEWLTITPRKTRVPKAKPDPLVAKVDRLKAQLADWHRKERLAKTKVVTYSRALARAQRQLEKRRDSTPVRLFEQD